jgi:hypothetical protein
MEKFTDKDRTLAREVENGKNTFVQKMAEAKEVRPKPTNKTADKPVGKWTKHHGENHRHTPPPEDVVKEKPVGRWNK